MADTNENGSVKTEFLNPEIQDNPTGWGPLGVPEQFRHLPFQNFSKGDRLGRVADITGQLYTTRGPHGMGQRYAQQTYNLSGTGGQVGTLYAYNHDDEDSNFQLVNSSKPPKSMMQRANRMRLFQQNKRLQAKERERRALAGYGPPTGKAGRDAQRGGRMQNQRGGKNFRGNFRGGRYNDNRQNQKTRPPSIQIRPEWEVLEEMNFSQLQKLNLPNVGNGEDIHGERYGTLEYYDKSYDRVTTKTEKPLQRIPRNYFTVTTTEDPVIQKLARQGVGHVYATDVILATLMCCTRSVYSWDLVAIRIGDNLFLDKRDRSEIDYLTVSETAQEPPQEEGNSINSPRNLALEATFINRNFSQQVLKRGEKEDTFSFEHAEIPFLEDGQDPKDVSSVGYRYRKWNLPGAGNSGDYTIVARTEHDGVMSKGSDVNFMTIKAFNEWDSRFSGGENWRSKLEAQKGTLLATEMKNNGFKLAKWTVQSLLAGSDILKFGYVSRFHSKDSSKHVILGTTQFSPPEFAGNITLKMENCWGILRVIIDRLMDLPQGKYLLMKDPNKKTVRLYKLPTGTFDTDDESEDEEDEDDDEDDEDADDETEKQT